MLPLRYKLLIRIYRFLDQAILVGVLMAVFFLRPDLGVIDRVNPEGIVKAQFHFGDLAAIIMLLGGWFFIYNGRFSYTGNRFSDLQGDILGVLKAGTMSSFWLLLIAFAFGIQSITLVNIVFFWGAVVMLGVMIRFMMKLILSHYRRSGYNYRYLLIIGANEESLNLTKKIESRKELGYKLVGLVAEDDEEKKSFEKQHEKNGHPVVGVLGNLTEILKAGEVDEVMVCLSAKVKFSDVAKTFQCAKDLGVVLRVVPTGPEADLFNDLHVENFEGRNLITFFRQQQLVHLLVKRMMDVTLSFIGLLLISPFLLLVALMIKLSDGGPVFFSQSRVGMNNRRFKMHKFRTMVVNAEELKDQLKDQNERTGPVFKINQDPRVTRVGRFLRKFSIDEFPQLFNVLIGEMSLVGPRPPLQTEVEGYEWKFRRRLSIPQGITCLWQAKGRDDVSFNEWMDLDSEYIDNWSIWLDVKILFMTIPAVLFGKGAS